MIFGAGIVDLTFIAVEAVRRARAQRTAPPPPAQSGGLSTGRLALWVVGWGVALVLVATLLLGQPLGYVLFALVLVFLFVFINGISQGISDWNPISSAFVVSVLLMSAIGLRDPIVAMMAASVLLVSTIVGVDMQQDRSTGWRLGSNRAIQFRYQAAGIVMGAVLCVVLAEFFMSANPVLRIDLFAHPEAKRRHLALGDDVQVRRRASAASATWRPFQRQGARHRPRHRRRHRARAARRSPRRAPTSA